MKQDSDAPSFGDIDELLERVGNKYLLVNAARVRAQQLVNKLDVLVDGADPEKAVSSAFAEIRAGKLNIEMDQSRGRK
ncbi:MAG: DNA-directed RNA polymerase subunit omega [Candidatus Eremiobacteraeota bacterium]|nr:DNA-directed RNA polymerase subunit omega [Candidatus Eremiobacteraeota bacterium]MBC5828301.1 DNA-directed RNA polymerase subunit omega [Candidatus Eremiobacteraeota bacterium]